MSDRVTSTVPQRVVLFLVLTVVGLWPALWTGGPLLFSDSAGYYQSGGQAFGVLEGILAEQDADPSAEAEGDGPSPNSEDDNPSGLGLRSLPFSVFTNVTMRALGPYGTVLAMSAMTAWLILLFVARLPFSAQVPVTLGTVALTLMPFYAAQLMPDILAGTLILAAMVIALRPELGAGPVLLLLGVICFGIVTHYAHIPLGLAICLWLFAVVWRRGARLVAFAMLTPITIALLVNLGISALVQLSSSESGEASAATEPSTPMQGLSIAPARFPILLARSLEDGPALKYLQDVCPDPRFTMCELYDEFPSNAGAALWGPDSIYNRATPEQEWRIANEEIPLLWAAFKAYPFEQAEALLGNSLKQFFLIGFPIISAAEVSISSPTALDIQRFEAFGENAQRMLETMQLAALALALIAIFANYRVTPGPMKSALWLLLMSLVVNAAVCGGLSAPVDRYQGRIIWCVVLLGFAALALRPTFGFLGRGRIGYHP